MSTLKATTIEPATGTNVTLGTTGDTVVLPGNTLVLDTWKDSGGNTLFASNGSGSLSNVNSALAGAGPVLIQSQTASGASTVDFTSGIDSTYDKYMFVFINIATSSSGDQFTFQVNASGESGFNETITSTFFEAQHKQDDTSASLDYNTGADQAQGTSPQTLFDNMEELATYNSNGILYLFAPSSTTYVKQFYLTGSFNQNPQRADNNFVAGYINTTAAITQAQFKMSSGTVTGTIKLYGVK